MYDCTVSIHVSLKLDGLGFTPPLPPPLISLENVQYNNTMIQHEHDGYTVENDIHVRIRPGYPLLVVHDN